MINFLTQIPYQKVSCYNYQTPIYMSGLNDKMYVKDLIETLFHLGMRHAVVCPGSGNASLILAIAANKDIKCYNMVDERCAGYFALGIAKQQKKPVALITSSGSAVLNLAPSIAEAYYQYVPLIVITADRPPEMVNQGYNQTINQNKIYSNYTKSFFSMSAFLNGGNLHYLQREISKMFLKSTKYPQGPVHINIPVKEPLFEIPEHSSEEVKEVKLSIPEQQMEDISIDDFCKKWKSFEKILIIPGAQYPNRQLVKCLESIVRKTSVAVLSEHLSNLKSELFIDNIDKVISTISESDIKYFKPNLLITFGNRHVSSRIKRMINQSPPEAHWHIDQAKSHDRYNCLTRFIKISPEIFFWQLAMNLDSKLRDYYFDWKARNKEVSIKHDEFISKTQWCDLKAFSIICNNIPANSVLHLSNSSPLRYTHLFPLHNSVEVYNNRGTCGIDGCLSTAMGYSNESDKQNIFITGDISFIYDSNALWTDQFPNNLKILIINNNGGDYYRQNSSQIDDETQKYFSTPHKVNIKKIADAFGIEHVEVSNESELSNILNQGFLEKTSASILEIKTPYSKNKTVLDNYYNTISKVKTTNGVNIESDSQLSVHTM